MPPLAEVLETPMPSDRRFAALLARRPKQKSETVQKHCVCINSTVSSLLAAAKPERQSMPEFLREAALTVALQRLEASQK